MNPNKKVLLINAHLKYPNWSEGALNDALYQKAREFFTSNGFKILETTVENGYEASEEVEKHLASDIIILQTPINWFGAPWIYKKYVDEVFNSGLHSGKLLSGDGRTREDAARQYGTGGKMHGKKFMISATWNAPRESFNDVNQMLFRGISTDDFLMPISGNYRFCGVDILPSYNCFDIFKSGDTGKDVENYPMHLKEVIEL